MIPGHDASSVPGISSTPPTDFRPGDSSASDRRHRKLYVDRLLEDPRVEGRANQAGSLFKANEKYVASSNIAFFSESRIRSLSIRLGNDKLREVVERIDEYINARMNPSNKSSSWIIQFRGPSSPIQVSKEATASYIGAYFDQVHPTYPFLDRNDFECKASRPDLPQYLEACPPFSALYHTVLALGCQYTEGGSFDPGDGEAWKLFQVSLGLFLDLLVPRETLTTVQAITAMSIFALNLSCIQIGETLTAEAARMVQSLGYHKALYAGESEIACQRTFWVVYSLEKISSFFIGKGSAFLDLDIGCPIPETPSPGVGGIDWFLLTARFSRLVSKAYDMLFSVTATMNSTKEYYAAIDEINDDLETWRKTFPKEFRPGEPFRPQTFSCMYHMLTTLKWHYFYYGILMSLCRLTLHVGADTSTQRLEEAKVRLMNSARVVIDLTRYVDAEPYTSVWMLGIIPLSALFILFDFVIHNPFHPETSTNLALLGVAVGHFSRLDYATRGSLPCSILSDFAHLAHHFVRDELHKRDQGYGTDHTVHTRDNNNARQNVDQGQYLPSAGNSQEHGYLSGQMTQTSQVPNGNPNPINHNGSLVNDPNRIIEQNLLYPVPEFPAPVGGEVLAGFGNLFDVEFPDFTLQLQ
ncbi:hypothetical protein MAP00_004757 [Monascus purpureus]|nr:hypothetical protein MAP00_004757 [Monascus purpureus]